MSNLTIVLVKNNNIFGTLVEYRRTLMSVKCNLTITIRNDIWKKR